MCPRAKAFGILLHNERVLVQEYNIDNEQYYRPLGGSIEFGEKSTSTVVREFKEELGIQVNITAYLGCLENIFSVNDEIAHEIIQLYTLHFLDTSLYTIDMIPLQDEQTKSYAKWIPITAFFQDEKILYPNGLATFIETKIKDGIL
ncbi:NUDIX domain-containing protein [Bacillus clarus]|uniref:NUDIX domain protein n=1 Tax=Bacillus clarus TaxID=2338372 RepID=A0A090YNF1_9BACI|nr:NUDIX hydrolase [Bacillus clarus]KFM99979.1 NUDIX domain protein [Bacillus clarus]RFT68021.1 NUDIX domain-containing protein [Bacillus clarus]